MGWMFSENLAGVWGISQYDCIFNQMLYSPAECTWQSHDRLCSCPFKRDPQWAAPQHLRYVRYLTTGSQIRNQRQRQRQILSTSLFMPMIGILWRVGHSLKLEARQEGCFCPEQRVSGRTLQLLEMWEILPKKSILTKNSKYNLQIQWQSCKC